LSQNIQKLNKEETIVRKKHEDSVRQCEYIIKEKERLLADLRIQAELIPTKTVNSHFISTVEQNFENENLRSGMYLLMMKPENDEKQTIKVVHQ